DSRPTTRGQARAGEPVVAVSAAPRSGSIVNPAVEREAAHDAGDSEGACALDDWLKVATIGWGATVTRGLYQVVMGSRPLSRRVKLAAVGVLAVASALAGLAVASPSAHRSSLSM